MTRVLAVALVALAGIGEARADDYPDAGKSVLVVPFTGAGSDSERLQLSLAAIRGVRGARAKAELAQTSAADLIAINGCTATDADCLATLPAALGVDVVVFGKVKGDGDDRAVVLVRVEANHRGRNAGKAANVEAQAAALFGVKAPKGSGDGDGGGGGDGDGDGDKNGGGDGGGKAKNPFSDGYTGDLGGHGVIDNREPEPVGPANYGRRDGGGLDFDNVERYSWGLAIGGSAAVAVGAVFLILGDSTQGDIDDAPTDTADQLDDLESLESRARLYYGVGNALAVGGLVTAAVGGALILYQASRESPESEPPGQPAIGLAPIRGGAMVTIGVRR